MTTTQRYHHGDLRTALLDTATSIIEKDGIEALSLRKLAENVGVSRSAPYHHFTDKNALLSAVAQNGFEQWQCQVQVIFEETSTSLSSRFRRFVHSYVNYAASHPQVYELMFGRTLWQQNHASTSLKDVAYPCFQFQVSMTRRWQENGLLPASVDAVRLAQVTWSTLHGMARLLIDGIYADANHIHEMCDVAVDVFMNAANRDPDE